MAPSQSQSGSARREREKGRGDGEVRAERDRTKGAGGRKSLGSRCTWRHQLAGTKNLRSYQGRSLEVPRSLVNSLLSAAVVHLEQREGSHSVTDIYFLSLWKAAEAASAAGGIGQLATIGGGPANCARLAKRSKTPARLPASCQATRIAVPRQEPVACPRAQGARGPRDSPKSRGGERGGRVCEREVPRRDKVHEGRGTLYDGAHPTVAPSWGRGCGQDQGWQ